MGQEKGRTARRASKPMKIAFAGGKGTWGAGGGLIERFRENPGRERMKDAHCWTEAVYQSPIPTAIFFKSLLPFLQKFVGEGIL